MALDAATIAEIKRKAAAGIPLTNPTPEKKFIYDRYVPNNTYNSVAKPTKKNTISNTSNKTPTTTTPQIPTAQNVTPTNFGEILDQLSGSMSQYMAPYEQMYRDMIANYPKFETSSEEEMLKQAGTWAGLQVDPQMQALQRALEQAQQTARSQESKINANYASFQDSVNRMLDQASQKATESAIARGGGRSGAVEWLNNQYSTPIMEQAATQEAKHTADLNSIAEALALAEQQAAQKGEDLESRRGELEAARLAELQNLAQAQKVGDWQRIAQATQNLMNMATQAQQFNNQFAANLLPYFQSTVGQNMDYNLGLVNALGEVPESLSSVQTPSQIAAPISLRDYASNQGASIGYDPASKSVIINGKKYSTDALQRMGGKLVNGSWMIPQSAVNGLF